MEVYSPREQAKFAGYVSAEQLRLRVADREKSHRWDRDHPGILEYVSITRTPHFGGGSWID
jgi:hypothetical protein